MTSPGGDSEHPPRPQVLGHRANSYRLIEAYKNAGAEGVEVDVFVNSHNNLRVEHILEEDEYLDLVYKTERSRLPSLRVLYYRLTRLLGRNPVKKPLLGEYLRYMEVIWPQSLLMIDLKTHKSIQELNTVLGKADIRSFKTIYITSKYHTILPDIEDHPNVKKLVTLVSRPLHTIEYLRSLGADGISIEYPYVDRELVRELHREGYIIAAWTVNDSLVARHLYKMGVDVIITDTPRKIIKALRKAQSREHERSIRKILEDTQPDLGMGLQGEFLPLLAR